MALQYPQPDRSEDQQMQVLLPVLLQGLLAQGREVTAGEMNMRVQRLHEQSETERQQLAQAFQQTLLDQQVNLARQSAIEQSVLEMLGAGETAILHPSVQLAVSSAIAENQANNQALQEAIALARSGKTQAEFVEALNKSTQEKADQAKAFAAGKPIRTAQGTALADAMTTDNDGQPISMSVDGVRGAVASTLGDSPKVAELVSTMLNNELASNQSYTQDIFPQMPEYAVGSSTATISPEEVSSGGMQPTASQRHWDYAPGTGQRWAWQADVATPLSSSEYMDLSRKLKVGTMGLVGARQTLEAFQRRLLPDAVSAEGQEAIDSYFAANPQKRALWSAAGQVVRRISATPEGTIDLDMDALRKTYDKITKTPGPDGGLNWQPLREHVSTLMQDPQWWGAFESASREVDPTGQLPVGQIRQMVLQNTPTPVRKVGDSVVRADPLQDMSIDEQDRQTIEMLRQTAQVSADELPAFIGEATDIARKARAAAAANMALYRLNMMPTQGAPNGFHDQMRKMVENIAKQAGVVYDADTGLYYAPPVAATLAQKLNDYRRKTTMPMQAQRGLADMKKRQPAPTTQPTGAATTQPQQQMIKIEVPTTGMPAMQGPPQVPGLQQPQPQQQDPRQQMQSAAAPTTQPVGPMPSGGYVPGQQEGQ